MSSPQTLHATIGALDMVAAFRNTFPNSLTEGGFRSPAMLCDSWPTANLHGTLGERIIRRFTAPHVRLTRPQRRQPGGGQAFECRVRLLNVLEPAWRIELVKDDLAGKLDQR